MAESSRVVERRPPADLPGAAGSPCSRSGPKARAFECSGGPNLSSPARDLSGANGTRSGEGFAFFVNGGREASAMARRALVAGDGALPMAVREDVLLLVTELVTNAVRHAGVGPDQSLRVELRLWPRQVRVEVADPGSCVPAVRPHRKRHESGGWGLLLVERIADRWG